MIKSLTDILKEALIGKKIKLHRVIVNRTDNPIEFFLTHKNELKNYTDIKIIGESYGWIKSIRTFTEPYDGDYYEIVIVDEKNKPIHFNGLSSITSKLELID